MQNPTTPHLGLPLPSGYNALDEDLPRIVAALLSIDSKFALLDTLLATDDGAMDELQELVSAIKANAASIGSLISAKADKTAVAASLAELAASISGLSTGIDSFRPNMVVVDTVNEPGDPSLVIPAPVDGMVMRIIGDGGLYRYDATCVEPADGEMVISNGQATGRWVLKIASPQFVIAYALWECLDAARDLIRQFAANDRVIVETITAGSQWTCPDGVYFIRRARLQGAGGSGLGGQNVLGGYGGGYLEAAFPVTPGATYAIAIGAGGTGTTSTTIGNSGGDTSFTANGVTYLAQGGGGANRTAAGAATGGYLNISGGAPTGTQGGPAMLGAPGQAAVSPVGYGAGSAGANSSGVSSLTAGNGVIILEYRAP